jgi:lysophospholipase L1-like esterase
VFFFHRGSWVRRLAVTAEADARRIAGETSHGTGDPAHRQRALEFLLERMRADTARVGAQLVVVYIPYLERGGTNAAPPALEGALRSVAGNGVTVVDLAPVVTRYYADPARPLLRFERDAHPNAAAHALIAEALEGALRRAGLVPPP